MVIRKDRSQDEGIGVHLTNLHGVDLGCSI